MHPSFFVRLEAFPLTPNGKIDRKALPRPASERVEMEEHHRPRDPLERQLAEIWEEILQVHPIGIRDNFFDLGGHSLLSVRMIDRVERAIGRKIPLSVLFEEPTIEHLSAHLIGSVETQRSSVVKIQPGNGRTPFFFLHGDYNGGGFYCANLAKDLGEDLPFYAVQPFGLDGESIPSSIETMAAEQLNSIREIQGKGPYLLGGYCNGAAVAFEMARQLERQGERVELLLLLCLSVDSSLRLRAFRSVVDWTTRMQRRGHDTATRRMIGVRKRLQRLTEIQNDYRSSFADFRNLRTIDAISFLQRNGFSCIRNFVTTVWSLLKNQNEDQLLANAQPDDRHTRANEAYRRALFGFVPKRYHGNVTLLWPRELALDNPDDPTCGWGRVARQVNVRTVPGGHITCLTNNVVHLARAIKSSIDTAIDSRTTTH
jgi:thioesterase domain-containing protein